MPATMQPIPPAWEDAARARLNGPPPPPFAGSVTAFFPAYNDAHTIGTLVDYTDAVLSRVTGDYEIIVVNDGSRDATSAALAAARERVPRLRVITHERNQGYGAALRAGFAAAGKEFLFYTDGDGQYDPTELLDLLPYGGESDLVNGYKRRRGDGWWRAVLGLAYRRIAGCMFGLRVRDVDCDFRLIRTALLQSLPLESQRGSICVEMVYRLQQLRARVVEVPVNHYRRVSGRSQFLVPSRVLASVWMLGRLWWRLRFTPALRPLRSRPWSQLSLAVLAGEVADSLAGLFGRLGSGL